MIKLKVKYHLTPEGLLYFPAWYKACQEETSKQPGFVDMFMESESQIPIVHLHFQDERTLSEWTDREKHDEFVDQIQAHFSKPPEIYRL
jgi:antibiotic biosynthesis monooxygenase (ABM) superfamily enzyme